VSDFTLDDLRKQLVQLHQIGIKDVLSSMPGMTDLEPEGEEPEDALRRIQGLIDSMTKAERNNPDVVDISRRRRIATGSGTKPHEIKEFIDQFVKIRTLMRQMRWQSGQ
jgi:signal recognition particle subunit SRP54